MKMLWCCFLILSYKHVNSHLLFDNSHLPPWSNSPVVFRWAISITTHACMSRTFFRSTTIVQIPGQNPTFFSDCLAVDLSGLWSLAACPRTLHTGKTRFIWIKQGNGASQLLKENLCNWMLWLMLNIVEQRL